MKIKQAKKRIESEIEIERSENERESTKHAPAPCPPLCFHGDTTKSSIIYMSGGIIYVRKHTNRERACVCVIAVRVIYHSITPPRYDIPWDTILLSRRKIRYRASAKWIHDILGVV